MTLAPHAHVSAGVWRHRAIVSAPLLALVLLRLGSPSDEGVTLCPFALLTGMACPGCGLTRAASALVHGDLSAALTYHPLVLLVGAQLAGVWVWYLLRRSGRVGPVGHRTVNAILIATLLALVVVWLARMGSGTLPPV